MSIIPLGGQSTAGRSHGTTAGRILGSMPTTPPANRWPAWVYGVGDDPDPRFSLANERTFLSWIRTGLAFITAGLGIAALARFAVASSSQFSIAAIVLLGCGVLCGVTGFTRWARNERAMRLRNPLVAPSSLPVLSVILLLIAGLAGFMLIG
jgi:putative membrane protein